MRIFVTKLHILEITEIFCSPKGGLSSVSFQRDFFFFLFFLVFVFKPVGKH